MSTSRSRWRLVMVLLLGCGLTSAVRAGGKAGTAKDPRSGSSSKELDILFRLAGRWNLEEKYAKNEGTPKGGSGTGKADIKKKLGGRFLIGDYKTRSKDLNLVVDGMSVFTYDSDEAVYRYWWFSNMNSQVQEFVGTYDSRSDALVFTRPSPGLPEGVTDRYSFKFKDEGTIVFKMEFGITPKRHELVLTTTYTSKSKKSADDKKNMQPAAKRVGRL